MTADMSYDMSVGLPEAITTYIRMCSLTIECVLRRQSAWGYQRPSPHTSLHHQGPSPHTAPQDRKATFSFCSFVFWPRRLAVCNNNNDKSQHAAHDHNDNHNHKSNHDDDDHDDDDDDDKDKENADDNDNTNADEKDKQNELTLSALLLVEDHESDDELTLSALLMFVSPFGSAGAETGEERELVWPVPAL